MTTLTDVIAAIPPSTPSSIIWGLVAMHKRGVIVIDDPPREPSLVLRTTIRILLYSARLPRVPPMGPEYFSRLADETRGAGISA